MTTLLKWRAIFPIGLVIFVLVALEQVYTVLIPLFLQAGNASFPTEQHLAISGFALSASSTGAIMTFNQTIALIVLPIIGLGSDRLRTPLGRRYPFILIGTLLISLTFVLIPFVPGLIGSDAKLPQSSSIGVLALFVSASTCSIAGVMLVRTPLLAFMADITPSAGRGKANGIITLMTGLGGIFSILVLIRLFDTSPALPFVIVSGALIFIIGILVFSVREPKHIPVQSHTESIQLEPTAAIEKVKQRQSFLFLSLAVFASSVGFTGVETFFSSFAVTVAKISVSQATGLLSIAFVAVILSAVPAGYIGASLGRKRTVIIGMGLVAGALLVIYLSPTVPVIAVALFFSGIGTDLFNVNLLPMMMDLRRDQYHIGTRTGVYFSVDQLATLLGPALTGFLVDLARHDYSIIFLSATIFLLVSIIFMLFVRHGEVVPEGISAIGSSVSLD